MLKKGELFIKASEIEWEDLGGGVTRKVLGYDDKIMMVKVAFEKGSIGSLHSHYHVQMSYVESGTFEIIIGNQNRILEMGDAYYLPPDIVHGAKCIAAGVLIDVFTPYREDFVTSGMK